MSYVYLAPLKDKTAFKIGKSEHPMRRLTSLSYIYNLDSDGIIIVKCPSTSASFHLETVLHEAFGDNHIQLENDGGTEFFEFSKYAIAEEICKSLCKGKKHSFTKFVVDKSVKPPTPLELILQKFSATIRNKRIDLGLSQSALATSASVSKRTVERLETNGQATFVNFVKIVAALGIEDKVLGIQVPESLRRRVRTRKIFVGDNDHEPDKAWIQTVPITHL